VPREDRGISLLPLVRFLAGICPNTFRKFLPPTINSISPGATTFQMAILIVRKQIRTLELVHLVLYTYVRSYC
jgi:hypothetical protein